MTPVFKYLSKSMNSAGHFPMEPQFQQAAFPWKQMEGWRQEAVFNMGQKTGRCDSNVTGSHSL